MPLYEYKCPEHGVFDTYGMMATSGDPAPCPGCGQLSPKHFSSAPRVFGDYPGYVSPASGKWIEGRKARERDFAETGTRPYEIGEWKTNVRRQEEAAKELDNSVDEAVERTIGELRAN